MTNRDSVSDRLSAGCRLSRVFSHITFVKRTKTMELDPLAGESFYTSLRVATSHLWYHFSCPRSRGSMSVNLDTLSGESFLAQLIIFPFLSFLGLKHTNSESSMDHQTRTDPSTQPSITPYINHITDHFVVSKIVAEEVML